MSQHVSLSKCREIADALRARGIDARADGQEACACCPHEVWSVVVGLLVFTDENGEWWGADARTGVQTPLGVTLAASVDDAADAIERGIALLSLARIG